jgi:diguanylate cyclase (GGDEF)-like protein/putative nucleotidyltransferase with HDIG domain
MHQASPPQSDPAFSETLLQSARILVVSSRKTVIVALSSLLGALGCQVKTANGKRHCLQLLLSEDFDVVIIDPSSQLQGKSLLLDLHQLRPWIGIILTGEPSAVAANGSANGQVKAPGHLPWPLSPEHLKTSVLEQVNLKQTQLHPSNHHALAATLDHLGSIFQHVQTTFVQNGLEGFLEGLSERVGHLIDFTVSAVCILQKERSTIKLHLQSPVSPQVTQAISNRLRHVYQILTDRDLPPLVTTIVGTRDSQCGQKSIADSFIIPILSNGHLEGLLMFSSTKPDAFATLNLPILYQTSKNISKLLPSLQEMRYLAMTDTFTGLYNRNFFTARLHDEWESFQLGGEPFAVLMLDIDRFKSINDNYGHSFGDVIIQEFARLMPCATRETDIIARYGGDELIVLLPHTREEQARACAQRFLTSVRKHVFSNSGNHVHLTISVGVAICSAGSSLGEKDVTTLADKALYKAKENGGDCICVENVLSGAPLLPALPRMPVSLPSAPSKSTLSVNTDKGRLLIVDDEPSTCQLFKEVLVQKGFLVQTATSALKALELIKRNPENTEVVLTDLNMPEIDGAQLLTILKGISPPVVPIMVTGFSSADNVIMAMRAGAYDFVRKPVNFDELEFVINRAIEHRRLRVEVDTHRQRLENKLQEKTRSQQKILHDLESSYLATLEALSSVITLREANTASHNLRVSEYALFLARQMKLPPDRQNILRRAALLHDIGKIGIPDSILLKAGPLSPTERTIVKEHSLAGYNILKEIPFLRDEAELVYSHHEHLDGSGYPRGLTGEQICLEARIFAVGDAFDAMRSDRVYRAATTLEKTVSEIKRHSGTQFDPKVVQVFLGCYHEMDRLFHQ